MNVLQAVEVENLVKRFPGVTALAGVSLRVAAGSIVAIVGENGAGKTTLMSILAGLQRPDAGSVHLYGRPVTHFDPHTLLVEHGVVLVPQELTLCRERTVAENVLLGVEPARGPFPVRKEMRRQTRQLLAELDQELDADLPVRQLSVAEQQLVIIARALARRCRLLILDEPTAVLTSAESERLFALLRRLRAGGTTILYVSHRIPEVFRLADEVAVMRNGQLVARWRCSETDPTTVVHAMVGRELREVQAPRPAEQEVLCAVQNLSAAGFQQVSFAVARGEILGIAGLPDSGRSALLEALFGARRITAGSIQLAGRPVQLRSPRDAIRAGIAYVPAERRTLGLLATQDLAANLTVLDLQRFSRFGFINRRQMQQAALERSQRFQIRFRDQQQAIRELSGGNQQKVILTRWLAINPQLLLLDEPTRGIDIGARAEIYTLLRELLQAGRGIILSSADLSELLRLCQRIAVMRAGSIVAILPGAEASEERIMELATGLLDHLLPDRGARQKEGTL
jgi:ABC-type sugar transport system ATPase subunit